jgi:HPt (histidine-containing phosphotransfer) domain-containing protein
MTDPDDSRSAASRTSPAREAVDALLETCGEAAIVATLIDTFLAEGPLLVARAARAVQGGDAPEARIAAHTLKSHGMTFGAPELARVAAELERLARDGALGGAARGLVGELAAEFERARDALHELREELAGRR